MRSRLPAVVVFAACLCVVVGPAQAGRVADRLADGTWQKVQEGDVHFRIYCEKTALQTQGGLPVVIYLHGRNWDVMTDDRFLNVPKGFAKKDAYKQRPCIVIVPQAPDKGSWDQQNVAKLLVVLDAIQKHFPTDRRRVYVTGYSMGADGTYNLLALAPGRFAAGVVAAGRPNIKRAKPIKNIPFRAFIGSEDEAIVVNKSRTFAREMKQIGATDFVLTELDGLGHGINDKVFLKTEGLHPWLFKQRRGGE